MTTTPNAGGCGCRITGPLGVGALLADPLPVYRMIEERVYAVAPCALHAAAPALLAALHRIAGDHYESVGYAQSNARAAIALAAPSSVGSAPPAAVEGTPQGASNPESALGRFALNLPPELP